MMSKGSSVHGRLATAAIAGAWLMTASCSRSPAERPASDVRSEVARLQRSTAMLERQVELATGKEFYLVLDLVASDLALMLRGAELQRYPVLGLTVGRPRVAWMDRGADRPWRAVIWAGGALDPPRPVDRVVVQDREPGQAGAEPTPPPVPPTAEERYPVPSRYRIRFADGLSVEIRPREGDTAAGRWIRMRTWWSAKWRDVLAVMRTRDRDALRLRIVLSPKDAESLYRALPPDVRLLVLAGRDR
jgi:hypothetical protein